MRGMLRRVWPSVVTNAQIAVATGMFWEVPQQQGMKLQMWVKRKVAATLLRAFVDKKGAPLCGDNTTNLVQHWILETGFSKL